MTGINGTTTKLPPPTTHEGQQVGRRVWYGEEHGINLSGLYAQPEGLVATQIAGTYSPVFGVSAQSEPIPDGST